MTGQASAPYDVVVVGGGPSGATAAYLLASHGFKVCLVDKCHFPRPKLCAGLLTWKSMELLNRVFGASVPGLVKKGVVTNHCKNYRIYLGPKLLARRELDYPFHFVDRGIYDNFWLRQSQRAGCQLITGQAVTEVDPIQGRLVLDDGTRLKAKAVIGADGVWSKVRRSVQSLEKSNGRWHLQLAATIETTLPSTKPKAGADHADIHFGYLPWGYAWSFPANVRQIVGICGLHRKGPYSLNHYFRNFLEARQVNTRQLSPWQSHPLPYGNHLHRPVGGRALLVGDACGLADSLLGEGIYYAHRSGELAARAIIASGLDPARIAANYQSALTTRVLNELRWIKCYRTLLFSGGCIRRFHGLRLFLALMPKRLEAAVHGQIKFSRLFMPRLKSLS